MAPGGEAKFAIVIGQAPSRELALQAAGEADVTNVEAQLAATRQAVTLEVGAAFGMLRSYLFRSDGIPPITALRAAQSVADSFRRGEASGLALVEARRTYNDAAVDAIAGNAALDDAEDTWPLVLGEMPR